MSTDSLARRYANTRENEWLEGLLLSLLFLWTPFVNFLITNSFRVTHLPVLMCFGGMVVLAFLISMLRIIQVRVWYVFIITGLTTLFIDITLHTIANFGNYLLVAVFLGAFGCFLKWRKICHLIAVTVVTAVLVGTVVQGILKPNGPEFHAPEKSIHTTDPTLPRMIHLILDEHIGVEGIPAGIDAGRELRGRILQFYNKYNFTLYGNAFSHYFFTKDSIPNALNFSAEADGASFAEGDRGPYKLTTNAYFNVLFQKHYRLYVLGSGWIDYCTDKSFVLETCSNYGGLTLGSALPSLNFTVSDQVMIILGKYLSQSSLYQGIRKHYQSVWSHLASQGVSLPRWNWDDTTTYPHAANTMAIIPELWKRILTLSDGDFLFAHLLFPHFSYLYKDDCSTHRSVQVFMNGNPALGGRVLEQGSENTPQSREERYRLYFQQVQCLYVRLDELFQQMQTAGIFENSIIILHGDHGARIGIHDPYIEDLALLSREDYADAFSTLFAVKFPNKPGGYNTSITPLEELLAETVGEPSKSRAKFVPGGPEPFVYVMSRNRNTLTPVFYPANR